MGMPTQSVSGLFTLFACIPSLYFAHVTGVEPQLPPPTSWELFLVCTNCFIGSVLMDYLWLYATVLTNSFISSRSITLSIPLSMLADAFFRKQPPHTANMIASATSPVSNHSPDFPVPSNSRGRVTEDKEAAQPVTYGPGNDDAKKELSHLNGDSRPTKTWTASSERDQTVGSECAARQKQQTELIAAVRERTTFALVHFICDLLEKPACASICCWTGVPGEFHIKSTRTFTDLWNTRNKSQVSFVKIASALKGYENTKIQGYTLLKRVNRGHYRFFPDCECSRLPF